MNTVRLAASRFEAAARSLARVSSGASLLAAALLLPAVKLGGLGPVCGVACAALWLVPIYGLSAGHRAAAITCGYLAGTFWVWTALAPQLAPEVALPLRGAAAWAIGTIVCVAFGALTSLALLVAERATPPKAGRLVGAIVAGALLAATDELRAVLVGGVDALSMVTVLQEHPVVASALPFGRGILAAWLVYTVLAATAQSVGRSPIAPLAASFFLVAVPVAAWPSRSDLPPMGLRFANATNGSYRPDRVAPAGSFGDADVIVHDEAAASELGGIWSRDKDSVRLMVEAREGFPKSRPAGVLHLLGHERRCGYRQCHEHVVQVIPPNPTEPIVTYQKSVMVPLAERHYVLGDGPLTVTYKGVNLAPAICWEALSRTWYASMAADEIDVVVQSTSARWAKGVPSAAAYAHRIATWRARQHGVALWSSES